MKLIISGQDKNRMELIEKLAVELGLSVTKASFEKLKQIEDKRSKELYQLMEEMAASGGLKSFGDPIEWQKEARKDRPLPGRD